MDCCHTDHRERKHGCGCASGRGHGHGFRRNYVTREERKERLEAYRDELRKELTGVDEALADLAKA